MFARWSQDQNHSIKMKEFVLIGQLSKIFGESLPVHWCMCLVFFIKSKC